MENGPSYVALFAVWGYWLGVLTMSIRIRRRGAASGLVPKQPLERLMWIVWVPVIGTWILAPWFSVTEKSSSWMLADFATGPTWIVLRWIAAVATVLCLGMTIVCWRRMGESWRVAVTGDESTELITSGLFARVRHPIYALSIVMMICTALAVPIGPMAIAAVLHVTLMNLKARNEERWMVEAHGDDYLEYRKHTGRFFPRVGAAPGR